MGYDHCGQLTALVQTVQQRAHIWAAARWRNTEHRTIVWGQGQTGDTGHHQEPHTAALMFGAVLCRSWRLGVKSISIYKCIALYSLQMNGKAGKQFAWIAFYLMSPLVSVSRCWGQVRLHPGPGHLGSTVSIVKLDKINYSWCPYGSLTIQHTAHFIIHTQIFTIILYRNTKRLHLVEGTIWRIACENTLFELHL